MKKILMIFMVFVYFVMTANAQMSESDLQKMYMDYLRTEGYAPTLENGGYITFKSEGKTYILNINAKDLEHFFLQYFFWPIESEQERTKAFKAASQANDKTKIAKIYMYKDMMVCDADIFIKQPQDFKYHFNRLIQTIRSAVSTFGQEMNK